jgi:hypothetical protein
MVYVGVARSSAVTLTSRNLIIPTWRPLRWRRVLLVSGIQEFTVVPYRGGTLAVRLRDGSVVRTGVQRTDFDALMRRHPEQAAASSLNAALALLRR